MKKYKKIKTITSLDNDILMLKRIYEFLNDKLSGKNPDQDFNIEIKDGNIVDDATTTPFTSTTTIQLEQLLNYKMAAHDLLSPLANQSTLLDLLKEEMNKILQYIEFLTVSNDKSLKISKAALKNNIQFIDQPISFKELVNDIIQILGIKNLYTDVDVIININNKKEFCNNTAFVQSILLNLIQNAIKYRKLNQPNTITISINDTSTGVKIIVQDTGVGMNKQRLEKLFKETISSDTTVKDSHGFGLYGVAQYVALLKGTITAQSTLKVGSRFIVELPSA